MKKIAIIAGIVVIILLAVILFKPEQEQISPEAAAAASADDESYLEMIDSNMVSGGVPKDGIPAIDSPVYVSAEEADIQPWSQVFGVVVDGVAKAYPQDVLYWHEVVNDEVNGKKFSVTYCPLTGTVIGYDDKELGVSGKLYNSNLVLYDRSTDSEIPQILGTAVNGPVKGEEFARFPVSVTSWQQWKAEHPDTLVMTRETGFDRDYDRNPYPGYESLLRVWFPVAAKSDQFESKKWVTGFEHNKEFLAVPKEEFREVGEATAELGGEQIKITYNSDLDTITAVSAEGEEILSMDSYWFAWYAYHPDTKVFSV